VGEIPGGCFRYSLCEKLEYIQIKMNENRGKGIGPDTAWSGSPTGGDDWHQPPVPLRVMQ